MADVDVMHSVTEVKKSRKVKKTTTTKRRESSDQGSEITITEIEQTTSENDKGYVCVCVCVRPMKLQDFLCVPEMIFFL